MIVTTFNSDTVYLINDAWDGRSPFHLDASILRDSQISLTKRETARPYSATLSCKVKYSLTLQDADLTAVIGGLRDLTTQSVVIPFWPALTTWSARAAANIKGGLMLVWKADWSQYEIYPAGAEPGWPSGGDQVAPALMGWIKNAQPTMMSPRAATWTVDFTESSPATYALQPASYSFAAGPQPTGYATAPRVLPFDPDFRKVSGAVNVEVSRVQIGFSRDYAETFYPHASWRSQSAGYTLISPEPAKLLRFFRDVAGVGQTFWATDWVAAATLTADVASSDTVLNVRDTNAVKVGDYISLFTSAGITRKVTAKTSTTITISSAPGAAQTKSLTSIFPLCLARLDKPTVSIEWKNLEIAKAEMMWSEVPPEVVLPGDETLGTSIGQLAPRVVLFQFTRDYGNGTVSNWYFTNYEKDLTWNTHTWTSGSFSVGDISQTLNLENDVCEVTSFIFAGNPLVDDLTRQAEAPLTMIVRFADYDGTTVSNVVTVFTGDCSRPRRTGSKFTMSGRFGPALLETELPRMVRGTSCNNLGGSNDGSFLISAGCTLLKSAWKFTGLVHSPLSAAYPYSLSLGTLTGVGANAAAALAGSGIFANWFANGWVEWGAAAAIQRRAIVGSTTISGGVIALSLHRYFNGLPSIGDTVTFYPGCDGQYGTCKAYDVSLNPTGKFNNGLNFGGEPFTPATNPSTAGQVDLGVSGAKK